METSKNSKPLAQEENDLNYKVNISNPDGKSKWETQNRIKTTRYTPWNFIPKNIFEQFQRVANLYFLLIAILSAIPEISPVTPITTLLPLTFVMGVTAVKQAIEDWKRHQSDKEINSKMKANVLVGTEFVETSWEHIRNGDILQLEDGDEVPADLILLNSSNEEGKAYVETSNLDGETTLKTQQALSETFALTETDSLSKWRSGSVIIECEEPNNKLYSFVGRMNVNGNLYPLSSKQMLLRGSSLRDVDWVHGVVIFTGHDTKIMKNSVKPPFKMSMLDRLMNRALIFQFLISFIVVGVSTAYATIWNALKGKDHWYLQLKAPIYMDLFSSLATFIILYSMVIPISLYVSIELARMILSYYVNHDIKMKDSKRNITAKVKNSSLMEELGQISYIFADKTGTLTINEMNFKKCTINGTVFGDNNDTDDSTALDPDIQQEQKFLFSDEKLESESKNESNEPVREFLRNLSICHSVIPEKPRAENSKEEETTHEVCRYQATSPDEKALVIAAKHLGYFFHSRKMNEILVKINGNETSFEILATLEFTSDRKRMSVICKTPEGKIVLYTKGADSAIFERVRKDQQELLETTESHLQNFAEDGLRVLAIASKELDEKVFQDWLNKFQEASVSLENREERLGEVYDEIESDLTLIGGVGIEDKLQDKVPETLETLYNAGLYIWILTGDKRETAKNVGYSCKLIQPHSKIVQIDALTVEDAENQLDEAIQKIDSDVESEYVLIIDGKSLTYSSENEKKHKFLRLAHLCSAVIVCRISPIQKSMVVSLVKGSTTKRILAIGDGANDVPMIQEAHVGVGIVGKEGTQASRSADFSIGQFKFLKKLLLVHGRYSYMRISKLILYSFYKNMAFCAIQFWFNVIVNQASGQTIFDSYSLALFNAAFTFFPIQAYAALEQDIPYRKMNSYPQVYMNGPNHKEFNMKIFFAWVFEGIYQSAIIAFGVFLVFRDGIISESGQSYGIWSLGTILYTVVIVVVTLKIVSETRFWTWINFVVIAISVMLWFAWLSFQSGVMMPDIPNFSSGGQNMFWVGFEVMKTPIFWLVLTVLPVLALCPHYAYKHIRRSYFPKNIDIIDELEFKEERKKAGGYQTLPEA